MASLPWFDEVVERLTAGRLPREYAQRFVGEYLLTALTIVIPSAVLTALYFALARRLGIGRRWTLASCLVLSVLAGLAMCDVTLSELPGQSRLTYGLGLGLGAADLLRLCKALAPLALGVWLLRRSRPQHLGGITGGTAVPTQ